MVFLISRIAILAGCLFASIYGVVALVRHRLPEYFVIALIGVFTLFLARLFYFVLTVVGGDDTVFTVGVLGQVAAYLLFMTANRCFVPIAPPASTAARVMSAENVALAPAPPAPPAPSAAPTQNPARRPHASAIIAAGILCAGFCAVGFLSGDGVVIVCELLYALCLGLAVYFAVRLICQGKEERCAASLVPFNAIVCVLAYLNVLNEATIYLGTGNFIPLLVGLSAVSSLLIALMMPLLRRGVSTWPQP